MKKLVLLLVLCCMAFVKGWAQDSTAVQRDGQTDSLIVQSQDTVLLKSYAARYDPRKALLYAAVVPGMGQIYNKKYWKLPLVYGGFFALGYAINFYQDGYEKYKALLFRNLEDGFVNDSDIWNDGQGNTDIYTTSTYRSVVDQYRRQRDLMIVLAGAVYILQMVDAHVDAHLKEFDLNPRLQVRLEPMTEQNMMIGRINGASLLIKF